MAKTVFDLIQELSQYDADAEVVFNTEMELSIKSNGKEVDADVRGNMDFMGITQNYTTGTVTIDLRY